MNFKKILTVFFALTIFAFQFNIKSVNVNEAIDALYGPNNPSANLRDNREWVKRFTDGLLKQGAVVDFTTFAIAFSRNGGKQNALVDYLLEVLKNKRDKSDYIRASRIIKESKQSLSESEKLDQSVKWKEGIRISRPDPIFEGASSIGTSVEANIDFGKEKDISEEPGLYPGFFDLD